mgnify:CR=1 FL=1
MSDQGTISALLADRPDLEEPLDAVLAVDRRKDTWTFDDLPIESGPFGELVSRDVVESVGDEYRLADPNAVERALAATNGDGATATTEANGAGGGLSGARVEFSRPGLPALRSVDRTTAGLVGAAIALVALVRLHVLGSIYRKGAVVLSGNDPYYYRYWIEQIASASSGAFDFGALSELPFAVQKGEPLMVATLWWLAELLGGSVGAIASVMAWYPIVSAIVTAGLVYLIAVKLTADRRIGLASLLFLAIIPGHALRTSIGFADHHAFDFPWLAGTALALVVLADADREALGQPRTWLASVGLGVSVAGQVLAWEAGPLLIAPAGLAVVAASVVAVHDDRSPLVATSPIVGGLAVAAILAAGVHTLVGWHTSQVGYAPALVFVGALAVTGVAEAIHRTSGDARHAIAIDALCGVAGIVALMTLFPSSWASLTDQLGRLVGGEDIAETIGLFNPGTWGVLLLFGFALVLAVPAMVWASRRALDDARWGIAAIYAWYFLLLATFQVRFVGELAAFAAVFAGITFVWIAAWIDAIPWPDLSERVLEPLRIPDRGTVVTLTLLFLLVGSLGIVQVPVKTSQVTTDGDAYASAAFIEERSAELGQSYPDDYILSDWGENRMYNYFVNGEAESYGYARQHYSDFVTSDSIDGWYDRFSGRVGYVVLGTPPDDVGSQTVWLQLERATAGERNGFAHFRPVYRAPDGTRTVFAVVPGARITGTAAANETVTVSTEVSIPNREFVYTRQTAANATGHYAVRVSTPGTYAVDVGGDERSVTVPDAAVRNGTTVSVAGS